MIIRNLDSDHDWMFGKGKNNFLAGVNAIKLNIKTRLLEWLNDCFFAQNNGVDWKNRLDRGQAADLEEEIRLVVLKSFGVTELSNFSYNVTGRRFFAEYTVQTIFSASFTDF